MNDASDGDVVMTEWGDLDAALIVHRISRVEIHFLVAMIVARAPDGAPLFLRRGAVLSTDTTSNIADAEALFTGEIDGDGCTVIRLGHDGALHLCDVGDAARFAKILERSIGVASELLDEEALLVAH